MSDKSGRVDVVQRLLKMGANPNKRGQTDEQTPINVCVNCIAMLKNRDRLWKKFNTEAIIPEILDSIRRHSGGLAGFTLEDQKHFLESTKSLHSYEKIVKCILKVISDKAQANAPLESLREIAMVLLKAGADPNAEHSFPIFGCTPLMLAAELDELNIFEAMIKCGGDPKKAYIHPHTGVAVDCYSIAHWFRSEKISTRLRQLS